MGKVSFIVDAIEPTVRRVTSPVIGEIEQISTSHVWGDWKGLLPWNRVENSKWLIPDTNNITFITDQDFTPMLSPQITINGGNSIIKREVAKPTFSGTIKERWAQADWELEFQGVFIGQEGNYPKEEVEQLKKIFTWKGVIKVVQPQLAVLGIEQIVIESWSFPFTKGEDTQAYAIKAISDFKIDLFIK